MMIVLHIAVGLLCLAIGTRFGYWLKEKEIEEGSLIEALVPEEAERAINKITGKEIFDAADIDKGSNND